MSAWPCLPFDDVLEDVTAGNAKILQSDFEPMGRFAIVDQGQSLVAGYTDDESRVCRAPLPAIVFGDHTRCFKYVDFPFCLGADGVKVLRPKRPANTKYLYHYLGQLPITENGYSRHFKFLRRHAVVLPPLPEQQRIADILDRADALRAKRRAALAQLDELTQAIFLDMFGDPVANPHGWPQRSFGSLLREALRNGVSPSAAGQFDHVVLTLSAVTSGRFDPQAIKTARFAKRPSGDQLVDDRDFLICRGNGNLSLVGTGVFPEASMPNVAFPDTVIAARVDGNAIGRSCLATIWNSRAVRRQLEARARTTNGTHKINQSVLESILLPVPPMKLQSQFEQRLVAVRNASRASTASLNLLSSLFASLQHRAFRGEL